MNSRRKKGPSLEPAVVAPIPVTDATRTTRRWLVLITAAVAIAVVLAGVLVYWAPVDRERVELAAAVDEAAAKASPESAQLLQEVGQRVDGLLSQFPDGGPTLDVVAGLYERLGRRKDAVRCWQRAAELDPSLAAPAHAAIAAVAYQEGDRELAVQHYRLAMQHDAQSSVYPVRMAESLIDLGKFAEAVDVLENLLKTRPNLMTASVLLGQAYLGLKDYQKARQHLETGVALGPEFTNGFFSLATACARLGDQDKSREYMARFKELKARDEQRHRQSLQRSSDSGQVRDLAARTSAAVGRAYLAHGEYRLGEDCLLRACELGPADAEPRTALAWLYEQEGRTDEAVRVLTELAERAPDDLDSQLGAAAAFARLRRLDAAERAYRRAVELTPLRAGGYAALANFFLQTQQKPDEAAKLAEKAVELEPNAENHFLLSMVRRTRGDIAGALAAIDIAITLAPQDSGYRQVRRELDRLLRAGRRDNSPG